ncbi:hypothetical protein L6164_012274 [Bauhinia variegata]|uniref:Uncharacterized protein n=1 Tax=Bauhinia variegata TaxID=167791 RepID=A0ACB9P8J7_BAUVA|nr:hypothetical protein L6164_012274 [Bauhinia variegata]
MMGPLLFHLNHKGEIGIGFHRIWEQLIPLGDRRKWHKRKVLSMSLKQDLKLSCGSKTIPFLEFVVTFAWKNRMVGDYETKHEKVEAQNQVVWFAEAQQ